MVAKKILTEGLKKLKPYKPRKSKNDELDSFKTKKVHQTIKRRNKKRSEMAVKDHNKKIKEMEKRMGIKLQTKSEGGRLSDGTAFINSLYKDKM
tara:strand:+ start:412 stop:693 length:282 start_codon:yes stop_codon:yes gene_type:complete